MIGLISLFITDHSHIIHPFQSSIDTVHHHVLHVTSYWRYHQYFHDLRFLFSSHHVHPLFISFLARLPPYHDSSLMTHRLILLPLALTLNLPPLYLIHSIFIPLPSIFHFSSDSSRHRSSSSPVHLTIPFTLQLHLSLSFVSHT
jgi:hypothetical protein